MANIREDFAHLDSRAKRDWHLQISAAAPVCSPVLEIKGVGRLTNSGFCGESPSFLLLALLV